MADILRHESAQGRQISAALLHGLIAAHTSAQTPQVRA
jgi:hypothetical protein